jgi:hypothetical protein
MLTPVGPLPALFSVAAGRCFPAVMGRCYSRKRYIFSSYYELKGEKSAANCRVPCGLATRIGPTAIYQLPTLGRADLGGFRRLPVEGWRSRVVMPS